MSDYTPTTERVRETYSHALWPVVEPDLPDYSQFDRWLEQHDKEVAKTTEQRIIKLLEVGGPIEQIICDYWGDPEFDKDDALVLIEQAIKGEK